ncbi:MAG: alkaline phosphatase D family protein, partial [Verrucomicrobium sp.]
LESDGKGRTVSYKIKDGQGKLLQSRLGVSQWDFHLPGKGAKPRLAYASCNGFSSSGLAQTVDPGAVWEKLKSQHAEKGADAGPFSLLLMGGDQVYCDAVLELDGLFTSWWNLMGRKDMEKYNPTAAEKGQIQAFYEQVYLDQWAGRDATTQADVPKVKKTWPVAMMHMLASVPSVMMWDDHDVFDGWGSYTDGRQTWPVYKVIFAEARRGFALFQQRGATQNRSLLRKGATRKDGDHFSFGIKFCDHVVLGMDNRTERTPTMIMQDRHWDELKKWQTSTLQSVLDGAKASILVMSGVPVVWRKFGGLARNAPTMADDVLDHWGDPAHEGDRDHLVYCLFDWAAAPKVRQVTLLSGDVHVGGMGVLEGRAGQHAGRQVAQIVSSGIVHPAPNWLQWQGVLVGSNEDQFEVRSLGITGKMMRPAGSRETYLRTRNFVTLKLGTDDKLWVNWICEDTTYGQPYYAVPADGRVGGGG